MLNAREIAEKKFDKAAFGYRPEEVDRYLEKVSTAYDQLQNEKMQLERKLEVLAEKIEEYRSDEDNMRAALLDARKLGSSIVKDAQAEADKLLSDAHEQSDKVIDSIQLKAEKEKINLSHLQKEVATFKNQLLALYKNHLELISSLPEQATPERSEPQEPQSEPEPVEEEIQDTARPAEKVIDIRLEEEDEPQQLDEDEYELDEDDDTEAYEPSVKRESRFGELKFGSDYDLKRD